MRFEKRLVGTIVIMLLAVLSVVLPLLVIKNIFVTFILYYGLICLCVPLFDLFIARKMTFDSALSFLGFKFNSRSVLVGLIHGSFIFMLILVAYLLLRNYVDTSNVLLIIASWGANSKLLIFVLVIVFNGFVEEFFWRGYCLGNLQNKSWSGVILVTLFYVSYHLATIISFFGVSFVSSALVLSIAFAGLLWGWMRVKFQNTLASSIGHVLATAGYMIVFLLL